MTTVNSSLKTLLCGVMLLVVAGTARNWASATTKKAEDGLVLHWAFDEIHEQKVRDLSGKGNHGRIEGPAAWIPGVRGKAMMFGSHFDLDDCAVVWCDDNDMLNPPNITVMFWVALQKKWADHGCIIDKGWSHGWGIDPHYHGERLWFCGRIDRERSDFSSSCVFPTNQWTHVAVTFDGKMVRMYKNGEFINTTKVVKTGEDNITGWTPDTKNSQLQVTEKILNSRGHPLRVGGMKYPTHYIDELKIYNYALNEDMIKAEFNAVEPDRRSMVNVAARETFPRAMRKTPCENLTVNNTSLVKNGEAAGVIVLDEQAPDITKFAVKELKHWFKKIFSVEMPVVRVDQQATRESSGLEGRNLILVGESAIAGELGFTTESLNPDGFRIASRSNVLAIVGKDSRTAKPDYRFLGIGSAGTLYGAYRFLELLGVRWYFPWAGELGEVLPTEKDIRIDKMDIVSAPYFIARYAQVAPGMNALWLRRLGFGRTVHPSHTGHSFSGWAKKYQLNHPEWFALRADGSRGRNLCVSHPEVRDGIIKQAKRVFRGTDPELYPDFTIQEIDGAPPPCACPECKKKVIAAEGWFGETSDYWAEIAVNTANAVAKDFPDHRIVISAYNTTTRPPLKIDKLPSNVSLRIAQHRMYLWDDEVKNTFYNDIIGGWLKLKPAAVTFSEFYNFDIWGRGQWFGVPGLATGMISDNLKKSKALSEKSGIPFLGNRIWTNGRAGGDTPDRNYWLALNMYVTAKALWDPDLPVKPLLDEFYRLYFGPAEEPMKAFYEKLESVWASGKWGRNLAYGRISREERRREGWRRNNPWEVLFTPEILLELAGYLQKAKELAGKSPYKERLEMVGKQFNTTLKYARERGGKDKISAEDLEKALTVW